MYSNCGSYNVDYADCFSVNVFIESCTWFFFELMESEYNLRVWRQTFSALRIGYVMLLISWYFEESLYLRFFFCEISFHRTFSNDIISICFRSFGYLRRISEFYILQDINLKLWNIHEGDLILGFLGSVNVTSHLIRSFSSGSIYR